MDHKLEPDMNRLIFKVYAAATEEDGLERCLHGICELFESPIGMLVAPPTELRSVPLTCSVGFPASVTKTVEAGWTNEAHEYPEIGRMETGEANRDCDLYAQDVWHETPFYQSICLPLGMEFNLFGVISNQPNRRSAVGVYRPASAGAYSDNDKRNFETLLPHLKRALGMREMLERMRVQIAAAEIMSDFAPLGLLLVDERGTLIYGNQLGRSICERNDGLALEDGRIRPTEPASRKRFGALLAGTAPKPSAGGVSTLSIERPTEELDYQVAIVPLPFKPDLWVLPSRHLWGLFIYDVSVRGFVQPELLQSFYNLTDSEARICQLLHEDKSLAEAADVLKVSVNTIKTHLTHAYRKMGVRSQAELRVRLNAYRSLNPNRDTDRN